MTGHALSQPVTFRLKAAFRDLIASAGGLERAATITGYGKSSLHRWASPEHPDLMPIIAVLLLEADTGQPLVTAAQAALQGYALVRLDTAGGTPPSLLGLHAAMSTASATAQSTMADAIADGTVTPAEQVTVDAAVSALQRSAERVRQVMASRRPLAVMS